MPESRKPDQWYPRDPEQFERYLYVVIAIVVVVSLIAFINAGR